MILDRRRLYLFGAHLTISFVILLILLYLIFFKWYPHGLFFTSGGWQGTKIVFFVDMVLGPMLTLIVSNPIKEKTELIRDLCYCALIQIGALSYGVSLLVSTAPVFLSLHGGEIHAIQKDQIANAPDKLPFKMSANTTPLVYSDDVSRYDLSIPEFKSKAERVLTYGRDYGIPLHAVPASFDSFLNRKAELNTLTKQALDKIKQSPNYSVQELVSLRNENWYVVEVDGSFKDGYIAFDIDGKIHANICCH